MCARIAAVTWSESLCGLFLCRPPISLRGHPILKQSSVSVSNRDGLVDWGKGVGCGW